MYKLFSFGLLCLFISTIPFAAEPVSTNSSTNITTIPDTSPTIDTDEVLLKQQRQLDEIRTAITSIGSNSQLTDLNSKATNLSGSIDGLLTELLKSQTQLDSQLAVIGTTAEDATETETLEVTQKRNTLTKKKDELNKQIEQAKKIKEHADNLSTQLVSLRRNSLKTQLALNSGSILTPRFWSPLFTPEAKDKYHLEHLKNDIMIMWTHAWQPPWLTPSLWMLSLALIFSTLGYNLLNRFTVWIGICVLPRSHLRRSFLAVTKVIVLCLVTTISIKLLFTIFSQQIAPSSAVNEIITELFKLIIFCSFIIAISKALLSTDFPSWRLSNISDPVAQAMKPFPMIIASLVFILGTLEIINSAVSSTISTTIIFSALTSLLISSITLTIIWHSNKKRRLLLPNNDIQEKRQTRLLTLIQFTIVGGCITILIALVTGYISLAHFLTYQLLWASVVLSMLYLLLNFAVDISEAIFLPTNITGERLEQMLTLDDRRMIQANTIVTAISKIILVLLALTALLNGTFGSSTPLELLHNATQVWGIPVKEHLNLMPGRLFNTILVVAIGLYLLKTVRRWLEYDFLPKTTMDIGIQASLVTLFSNIGYVIIILMALATLGIEWNSLTWIVSALSVGIGFGLQEIVKNFISGLILLTERPVKVGDLVSISGIEGDIRRINVRATEIQLSDRSTVIVPNSQLISQNVRNVTMNNALGVVTIELKCPLELDPDQISQLLLNIYKTNTVILTTPVPTIVFKQIDPDGVIVNVTGFVKSPRLVSNCKSDVIYQVLKQLHTEKLSIKKIGDIQIHFD